MVMVVGVLAMLFIIGSTLLIVGRFERQTVQISMAARSMEAVSQGILESVFISLRQDLLGSNDKAYLRNKWDNTLLGEDYGDYPGFGGANSPQNGDLLLSSVEPYFDPGGPGTRDDAWKLFAVSWPSDFPREPNASRKNLNIFITDNPLEDADGDGIRDAAINDILGFNNTFGGTYRMSLRVIPHNAMVWLNRMTHPTLLAQVIHPTDRSGMSMNQLRTVIGNFGLGPTDENRLRRRFMLPPLLPEPDSGNYANVASVLVQQFAITTGYANPEDPVGWRTQPTNRWTMFRPSDKEQQDWARRLKPTYDGLTDPDYSAARDTYDRRHLITTESSDDALRPQRDEKRLEAFAFTLGVLPDVVTFNLENIISPADASLVSPASVDPNRRPLAYGVMDYRPAGGSIDHVFNTVGLRTQFSLRDVLEPVWVTDHWEGQASYRRAMQLTAYFLAMIQHTTVPGSNVPNPSSAALAEQLRTAMQLAVNVIDFADADQIPTYFEFDNGVGLAARVVGVEKQPYITEVYVKRIKKGETRNINPEWFEEDTSSPPKPYSIYAVELYNPYDATLDLSGYWLRTENGDTNETDLGSLVGSLEPHSYVVIANRKDDPITGKDPFITGAATSKLFIQDTLKIDNTHSIRLVRKNSRLAELTPAGLVFPAVTMTEVEIDRVDRNDPGSIIGDPDRWAIDAAELATNVFGESAPPAENGKWLVRDSSLQRHKDPAYWHFTLSRQVLFPLPWYEHPDYPNPGAPAAILPSVISATDSRPDQHNLLNTGTFVGPEGLTNAQIVAREFAGIAFAYNSTVDPRTLSPEISGFPNVFNQKLYPIAGFPVLTADRGVHPNTGGTMAFPTTGTLLLVTRYAHLPMQGMMTEDKPLTVAAMDFVVKDFDGSGIPIPLRPPAKQVLEVDNGHLPVFDEGQKCQDGNNSRFHGLPWGQLAFEYFTALPMEELARDVEPLTPGLQRLMDSPDYVNEYAAVDGAWNNPAMARFINYPVMMPVSQASSPLGPRVQGRIGIGNAPWWVLDGLPVLPDAMPGTINAIPSNLPSSSAVAGLPVPEIEAQRLDPPLHTTHPASMAGAWFVHDLIDEKYAIAVPPYTVVPPSPPADMPSISPRLAQYMVSYREQRPVGAVEAVYPDRIGFATAGEICNVLTKVQLGNLKHPNTNHDINEIHTLQDWRRWEDSNNERPFSYLGYLQLVTPIARMQDWMTVKNHVFTIYATIQSSGQPPVTVRTQVTVDRTRCLYNPSDLPERITETPPISYYNMMDD
ncbi:MAG: hypothetical protein ACUVXJ_16130 [Phycisphaerae bacterium]